MTGPDDRPLMRLRRQRLVERVHRLGPRVLFEFLDELGRHHPALADDIDQRLERYAARLTPGLLRATGGDRFAASLIREIGGGR